MGTLKLMAAMGAALATAMNNTPGRPTAPALRRASSLGPPEWSPGRAWDWSLRMPVRFPSLARVQRCDDRPSDRPGGAAPAVARSMGGNPREIKRVRVADRDL